MNDTIYALSTPPGNGVAVIRISGPECLVALKKCFTHRGEYESHRLYYGRLRDMMRSDAADIDECMAVWMQAPRSYTAEDCAELHCHGSLAVLEQALALLSGMGLRPAEPGEFTRRAFENGRLDLSQAEAVMDLIHASATASAQSALRQVEGALARRVAAMQDQLTDAIAQIEAAIDYPEEDWEDEISEAVRPLMESTLSGIETLLAGGAQGRILREGLQVALAGRPNAGKSTLLNALLGEERAIVTDIAGTTRDTLEETISIDGLPVRLTDTAGLRESDDPVERIGVERSRRAMEEADVVLLLIDSGQSLSAEDVALLDRLHADNHAAIIVLNKEDLPTGIDEARLREKYDYPVVAISARDGSGLDALRGEIRAVWARLSPVEKPGLLVGNRRQLDALAAAERSLVSALDALEKTDMDCVTIDLRAAWHALGQISGNSVEEGIVDRIFEKFCLGK